MGTRGGCAGLGRGVRRWGQVAGVHGEGAGPVGSRRSKGSGLPGCTAATPAAAHEGRALRAALCQFWLTCAADSSMASSTRTTPGCLICQGVIPVCAPPCVAGGGLPAAGPQAGRVPAAPRRATCRWSVLGAAPDSVRWPPRLVQPQPLPACPPVRACSPAASARRRGAAARRRRRTRARGPRGWLGRRACACPGSRRMPPGTRRLAHAWGFAWARAEICVAAAAGEAGRVPAAAHHGGAPARMRMQPRAPPPPPRTWLLGDRQEDAPHAGRARGRDMARELVILQGLEGGEVLGEVLGHLGRPADRARCDTRRAAQALCARDASGVGCANGWGLQSGTRWPGEGARASHARCGAARRRTRGMALRRGGPLRVRWHSSRLPSATPRPYSNHLLDRVVVKVHGGPSGGAR